ncbi:MAG: hypothetical protein U1D99_05775 [Candidatus Omnitrophota bacterium]|nr:hypothetical protein [Candidatus Omnitrophota bacterium]
MEQMLGLTPQQYMVQSMIATGLMIWMFVIFPVIVIRKLNYLTALLEAQYEDDTEDPQL